MTRKLQDYIKESAAWISAPAVGDDFAINIREECLVESHIVDLVEDGVVLAADDKMMQILESYGMLENDSRESVARAITHRILNQRLDLLSKYGPDKVSDAIDDVAAFVGSVEEIGSSDISGWVRQVERTLSSGIDEQGVAEAAVEEGTGSNSRALRIAERIWAKYGSPKNEDRIRPDDLIDLVDAAAGGRTYFFSNQIEAVPGVKTIMASINHGKFYDRAKFDKGVAILLKAAPKLRFGESAEQGVAEGISDKIKSLIDKLKSLPVVQKNLAAARAKLPEIIAAAQQSKNGQEFLSKLSGQAPVSEGFSNLIKGAAYGGVGGSQITAAAELMMQKYIAMGRPSLEQMNYGDVAVMGWLTMAMLVGALAIGMGVMKVVEPTNGRINEKKGVAEASTDIARRFKVTYTLKNGETKHKIMVGRDQASVAKQFEFKYRHKPSSVKQMTGTQEGVAEAMFPGSAIGDKLRAMKSDLGRDSDFNKNLMYTSPFLGASSGVGTALGIASVKGSSVLFAPAIAGGAAVGIATALGGFLTYKGLNWLAQKLFGTKEEALEFAKAHLKAALARQEQFEFQGKTYPVKIYRRQDAMLLLSKINNLEIELFGTTSTDLHDAVKKGMAEGSQELRRIQELAGMPMTTMPPAAMPAVSEAGVKNWIDDLYYLFNETYAVPADLEDDEYLEAVEEFLRDEGVDPSKIEDIGELFIDRRDQEEDADHDYANQLDTEQYDDENTMEDAMDEAKYQGREVPLGKPMAGDVKKSKVYVKGPKGNVVKVNFGDKKMRIKKSNPKRRKSFRARHNCANPGPRWKARYWSCRAW